MQVWSAIGREFSIATNQVDFAVPKRFGLVYKTRDNREQTPLCIHRAPLGTHERFIAFLIEHYAGNFPLWLAPEQVRVLTIGDDQRLIGHAKALVTELRSNLVRAELDGGSDPINGKIQRAEQEKVHTMLILGQKELERDAVSVRLHGKGSQGMKPSAEVPTCPDTRGSFLRLHIRFPECWDGRNIDSADHKSHMAYSRAGVCPSTHPISVPAAM